MTFEESSPIAIGGVGGSGTRVVADVAKKLNVYIGNTLNNSLDNLWFTFLIRNPNWQESKPDLDTTNKGLDLFVRAMKSGLAGQITFADIKTIMTTLDRWGDTRSPKGTWHEEATSLINSKESSQPYRHWGWKEPNTHVFLPTLINYFPNLKYIHVIRNGLDMAYSPNQNQLRNWNNYFSYLDDAEPLHSVVDMENIRKLHSANEPEKSLNFWIRANYRAIEACRSLPTDQFLVVNYERLCNNPDLELKPLIRFLGNIPNEKTIQSLTEQIKPTTIDRYKEKLDFELSEFQKQAIEEITGF